MTTQKKLLVTSALPYANGHLHLGHLVEHIQTDIWVRTQRLLGNQCISICADDAHGTPIMLKAEQLGMTPEALIADIKKSHEADFNAYQVHYDTYHSTHSEENKALATSIYNTLNDKNYIVKKTIQQLFDPVKEMFLPDRYVKGTCPKCKTPGQYGDNCEACGATYMPSDLIDPVSALSGATPVLKDSEHYFFDLPQFETFLKTWTRSGVLQKEMANKLDEWFKDGLKQWDISRDAPYFGFLIPGTDNKYFYVWLDAPIGYMASFKKHCVDHNIDFNAYWNEDSDAELYHFVGKDIMYFHALFWPALLKGADYRLPTQIFTHGFLTINGQKMSKSRGTFIEAQLFRKHMNPTCLRYYFAAKLNSGIEDIDFNADDFMQRVNSDLVGKLVNIASRSAGFITKRFDNKLSKKLMDHPIYADVLSIKQTVIDALIKLNYAEAIRLIMQKADVVNHFVDNEKPWQLVKEDEKLPYVQELCTLILNLYRILIGYLKPIIPDVAKASEDFLNCEPLNFKNLDEPLYDTEIKTFTPLMTRITPESITALLEEAKSV